MFCILAVIILGSAVMCVMTKSIMRAATFLLFVLFGVKYSFSVVFIPTARVLIAAPTSPKYDCKFSISMSK